MYLLLWIIINTEKNNNLMSNNLHYKQQDY